MADNGASRTLSESSELVGLVDGRPPSYSTGAPVSYSITTMVRCSGAYDLTYSGMCWYVAEVGGVEETECTARVTGVSTGSDVKGYCICIHRSLSHQQHIQGGQKVTKSMSQLRQILNLIFQFFHRHTGQ